MQPKIAADENQVPLCKLGAGTAALEALVLHKDDAEAAEAACAIIAKLATVAENQVPLFELGGRRT